MSYDPERPDGDVDGLIARWRKYGDGGAARDPSALYPEEVDLLVQVAEDAWALAEQTRDFFAGRATEADVLAALDAVEYPGREEDESEDENEVIYVPSDDIPSDQYGVHAAHCCLYHGCKYGDDNCPVVRERTPQFIGQGWCQEPDLTDDPEMCRALGVPDPALPPVSVAPALDYPITILDQGFEPEYNGWNIRFQAHGAPRFSYSKQDPILDAYVRLEAAPSSAPRLGSGGGSALARANTDLGDVMVGGGTEGQVLRGALGAAMVEVSRPTATPRALPDDALIVEACSRALKAHIAAVNAEKARLQVTEGGESVVGKRLTVKG